VAQLNVKLDDETFAALRGYAAARRTPVAWLVKDYVGYLLAGGQPVSPPPAESPSSAELTALAQHGGAFDWLAEEPDIYSASDGEPV
jgi:hypothetical protein